MTALSKICCQNVLCVSGFVITISRQKCSKNALRYVCHDTKPYSEQKKIILHTSIRLSGDRSTIFLMTSNLLYNLQCKDSFCCVG